MREVIIAELLLSLVMTRDRAAATAGDLLESSRGSIAFLWSLAGTMLGATFRQMSIVPMLQAVAWVVALTWLFRIVFFATLMAGGRLFPGLEWLSDILGVSFLLCSPILAGYIMARRLPGREVAAWLAVVAAAMCVVAAVWWRGPFAMHYVVGVLPPVSLIPMLLGVLLARRSVLRSKLS